jgi:hypothetical protein
MDCSAAKSSRSSFEDLMTLRIRNEEPEDLIMAVIISFWTLMTTMTKEMRMKSSSGRE